MSILMLLLLLRRILLQLNASTLHELLSAQLNIVIVHIDSIICLWLVHASMSVFILLLIVHGRAIRNAHSHILTVSLLNPVWLAKWRSKTLPNIVVLLMLSWHCHSTLNRNSLHLIRCCMSFLSLVSCICMLISFWIHEMIEFSILCMNSLTARSILVLIVLLVLLLAVSVLLPYKIQKITRRLLFKSNKDHHD